MFHKILVALDRSKTGEQVFDAAVAFAKTTSADLMLLHVLSSEEEGYPELPVSPILEYCPLDTRIFEDYKQQWQAYETQGLELLRSYTDKAVAAGVKTEFTQNTGSAGRVICEMAQTWGADLIVIGRRGLSGWNELVLGSVSNYVLHHANCSVFTVQHKTQPVSDVSHDQHAAIIATS